LEKELTKFDPPPVTLTHYPSQLCSHDPTSATRNSTKPKQEKKNSKIF